MDDVIVTAEGDVTVARLEDELDMANASTIAAKTREALPNDAVGLVVDLSAVRYIDSAGVQMLFELADYLRSRRRYMTVVVPASSPMRRLFEVTSFSTVAPVFASTDEAVAGLHRLEEEALG